MAKCRVCGRKTKRDDMTPRELRYSIGWCKGEIVKLNKVLEKKTGNQGMKLLGGAK